MYACQSDRLEKERSEVGTRWYLVLGSRERVHAKIFHIEKGNVIL